MLHWALKWSFIMWISYFFFFFSILRYFWCEWTHCTRDSIKVIEFTVVILRQTVCDCKCFFYHLCIAFFFISYRYYKEPLKMGNIHQKWKWKWKYNKNLEFILKIITSVKKCFTRDFPVKLFDLPTNTGRCSLLLIKIIKYMIDLFLENTKQW